MKKICPRCNRSKHLEEFSVNRGAKDKRYYICKECCREIYQQNREQIRVWQQNNPEKTAEYQRNYMSKPEKKKMFSKMILKSYKLEPEKVNCRNRAWEHKATLLGTACESCGSHQDLILFHIEYKPPYRVKTLCRPCLKKLPRRKGRPNPGHCQFKIVTQEELGRGR